MPSPPTTKQQAKLLQALQTGTEEEIIFATKKINSEARTLIRNRTHYLAHPHIITLFLNAINQTSNPKVTTELLSTLVAICGRHLPDLRTQPYFLSSLKSKITQHRKLGIEGLKYLYNYPYEELIPLIEDKSYLVRNEIVSVLSKTQATFPTWFFLTIQPKVINRPTNFKPFFPLFKDRHKSVQLNALELLLSLKEEELFPQLKELIPIYKEKISELENSYRKDQYILAVEKLTSYKV